MCGLLKTLILPGETKNNWLGYPTGWTKLPHYCGWANQNGKRQGGDNKRPIANPENWTEVKMQSSLEIQMNTRGTQIIHIFCIHHLRGMV